MHSIQVSCFRDNSYASKPGPLKTFWRNDKRIAKKDKKPQKKKNTYEVTKRNGLIVLKFNRLVQLRVHTQPNSYAPYIEDYFGPKKDLEIKKGQWAEMWTGQSWALMTDADNR